MKLSHFVFWFRLFISASISFSWKGLDSTRRSNERKFNYGACENLLSKHSKNSIFTQTLSFAFFDKQLKRSFFEATPPLFVFVVVSCLVCRLFSFTVTWKCFLIRFSCLNWIRQFFFFIFSHFLSCCFHFDPARWSSQCSRFSYLTSERTTKINNRWCFLLWSSQNLTLIRRSSCVCTLLSFSAACAIFIQQSFVHIAWQRRFERGTEQQELFIITNVEWEQHVRKDSIISMFK